MLSRSFLLSAGASALAFALCACGGGGGAGVASTPPPPTATPSPTPTPTPTPAVGPTDVTIFPSPPVGQFAAAGISANTPVARPTKASELSFSGLSRNAGDQVQLRYMADGTYEAKFPGGSWDTLINDPAIKDPTSTNDLFAAQHDTADHMALRPKGYEYSVLSSWGSSSGRFGYEAFGSATPSDAIPTTGSATYNGIASGITDIAYYDDLLMIYRPVTTSGTVLLQLDFGTEALTGSLSLDQIGTFAFAGTNFSAADGTYSGHFDSSASGENYFFGQLTGPNAQETIGAWTVPFIYSGDQQTHQAFGAWIAKQ